ncbi:uncharacterized protein [Hetaerina americana]|uniref:uncharacterized protein n=1 Tax=Hetaerina americana TaxID=62018 RepID=UPI003A7F1254
MLTSTPGEVFPRPSPPSVWNLTPRQQSASQSKLLFQMSPLSPANSEGWVTPNRLTLRRTPSPSNRPLSITLTPSVVQGLGKQRKPTTALGSSCSQKPGMHPKLHVSQPPPTANTSRGNFRIHRGYSTQPGTPLTPIHSNMGHCRESQNTTPSPRVLSYSLPRGSTPVSSGSLLSNLKLNSPV